MTTPARQQPQIETSFNLFNPGGDPSVLRACADAWRAMAQDLKTTSATLDGEATTLAESWTGAAADAFHTHWNHTKQQIDKSLPHFEVVAKQLDSTAEAIAKVNAQVHHVIEELAATALIGIGLSVITAGFSDLVAAGAAEAEAAEAAAEVSRLGQLLIKVAEIMEKIKDAMEGSKLLAFGVDFGKNTAANFVGNIAGQMTTGQKVSWGADLQDAAVAGAVGTGLGAGGQLLGGQIDGKVGDLLAGNHIAGGAFSGMATSAAGQAAADGVDIAEGSKSTTDLRNDTLTSGVSGGVAGGLTTGVKEFVDGGGEHRAKGSPTVPSPIEIALNGAMYGAGNAIETDLTQ